MARGRVLVRPEWTTLPGGDITATEWNDAKADLSVAYDSAQLANSRTYDTRAYPSIQGAIDAAHAAGGGTVFVGDSELTPQTLTLRDGVYLTGRGIGATTLAVNTIRGEGSITPLPGLLTAVAARSRTVTFTAAHGLQPGDVFVISDTTDSSFNAARIYYRRGEFCKVRDVSGNTVTLTHPLYLASGTYGTGANIEIYKLNPVRTGVSGMTLKCSPGKDAIKVTYGSMLEFRDLAMSGCNYAHINLSRCYSVHIGNVTAFDQQAEIGYNYGICIVNSQRIRIRDCELETRRHGFVTGGEGIAGTKCTVPCRDIIVSDSYINGMSGDVGVCGCNLHGNSEYVRFDNCTFPSGFNPAGDFVSYRNCTVGTPAWGSAVSCMEMLGTSLSIENCHFTATDNHQLVRGMLYLFFPTTCTRGGITKFTGNTVDLGSAVSDGANAILVYLLIQSTAGPLRYVYFDSNILEANNTSNKIGVRVVADNAGALTHISYTNNNGRIGACDMASMASAGIPVFFNGHGTSVPTFAAQRGSSYFRRATAGVSTGKLYVNENGDAWVVK